MKNHFNRHLAGFTLIELLVVVLIIGILAGVALPQYRLAVAKSRFTQLLTVGDNVIDSMDRYYMATNLAPTSIQDLDIEVPSQVQVIFVGTANKLDHVRFQRPKDLPGLYFLIYPNYGINFGKGEKRFCNVESSNASIREQAQKICHAVTGREADRCGSFGCRYPFQ